MVPQPPTTLRPAAPRRSSLLRLLPYLRPFWRQFALALALAPLGVAMAVFIPLLLGRIVEDVSGQSFDAYLREHVFGPLGMDDASAVAGADRAPPRSRGGRAARC